MHSFGLRWEGHEVKLWIKDSEARDIYKGILDSEKDWKPLVAWCDYAFFCNNSLGDIWEIIHKTKPCYCGSSIGNKLEKDRSFTHKIVEGLGIKCPKSIEVKTILEVLDYLKEHQIKQVVKFVGKDCDSDDIFIGSYDDNKDLIRLCERMKTSGKKWDSIEIEEKIDGVEVGCAGYFDGNKFAPGIEINFQHKPLCASENGQGLGYLTGEMGTVIKIVEQSNEFFKRTLAKMITYLHSIDYRGEIDMGFIVNEKGDFFIEVTTREGYPDCAIQDEVQETPWGEFCYQIAKGDINKNEYLPSWAMGVVVVCPGFPDPKSSKKRAVGLPIFGFEENIDHCALFEARKGPEGYEVSDGGYGLALVVTGKGETIEEARKNTYWLLDSRNESRVNVPKSQWRHDIGIRVLKEKERILSLGILSEKEWGDEKESSQEKFIATDLDKTLAYQSGDQTDSDAIGPPIPEMQKRVMGWIDEGKKVKILSARASNPKKISQIKAWLLKNGFPSLEATNIKEPEMIELYDDKAVAVIPNTGKLRNDI